MPYLVESVQPHIERGQVDIDYEDALFIDGLGLDSIDALELGVAIKKAYDVKIDNNSDDSKKHFYSVKTLCEFIAASRT